MSPRSENGGADSGGDSSGNESPTPDQEAAGTPDARGMLAVWRLAPRYQIRLHQLVPLPPERGVFQILRNHFCHIKQLHVTSRCGTLSKAENVCVLGS